MNVEPLIGSDLGGYRISRLIGRGGMGVVYEAESAAGDIVAVKVMLPELAHDTEFRERFTRESRLQLRHPNILPIYEAGEDDGRLYMAMYLVRGTDLKALLRDGHLRPARTASIIGQAAAGLDAAHESGVVHRDVKPQNILIEPADDDHVYLSDFGLVKLASSQSSVTSAAVVMGSSYYIAPEQIEDNDIDGRADVYSLGCVAYECLTGHVPFARETEVAVLWAQMNARPPSVTEKAPLLPLAIDDVIARSLAKSPDDRYLTCGEFSSALAAGLGVASPAGSLLWDSRPRIAIRGRRPRRGISGPRTFPTPARRSRSTSFLAGALAALLAFGIYLGSREEPVAEPSQQVTAAGEGEGSPSGPDARSRGKARASKGERSKSNEPLSVAEPDAGLGAAAIAGITQDDSGYVAPSSISHEPVRFAHAALRETRIVFWSDRDPDYGSAGALYVMKADGSSLQRLTLGGAGVAQNWSPPDWAPAWSPFGKIAFTSDREGGNHIYVMDPDGSGQRRVTSTRDYEYYPAWSPDGSQILFGRYPEPWGDLDTGNLFAMDADGTDARQLTNGDGDDGFGRWSPDGERIVFNSWVGDVSGGVAYIYVMNADGTGVRKLRTPAGNSYNMGPAWGPTGKIVFESAPAWDEPTDLYVVDPDGSDLRRLTSNSGNNQWPSWSPDGTKIVFSTSREGTNHDQLYVMDADGSNQTNVSPSPGESRFAAWETAHFRRVSSFDVHEGTASGRLTAFFPPCTWSQPVRIERRSGTRWTRVATTQTTGEGTFSVEVSGKDGVYRARSPFSLTDRRALCAPALSGSRRI